MDGVDFSAAEAFTRINRLLCVRDVKMIMCGFSSESNVGKALFNVGLLDGPDRVQSHEDLNSALESCENDLLKTLYHQKDVLDKSRTGVSKALGKYSRRNRCHQTDVDQRFLSHGLLRMSKSLSVPQDAVNYITQQPQHYKNKRTQTSTRDGISTNSR